jgi:hypothetical protein
LEKVHAAFIEKFQEVLPEKMKEAGVAIECTVLKSEDQADFFFDAVTKFQ